MEEGIMKKLGKPVPITAVVVLVITAFIITVILSVTVYRGKDPITMVDGVVLRDLHISHKVPKLTVDLNLSVKNPTRTPSGPPKAPHSWSIGGNPGIYMEMKAGMVPFNTYTKISGKVKVFNLVKVNVISTGLCGFAVDVKSKTVGEPKCS
ncbi:uncharacterized protein Pyn_21439 [Prunus yedoensis var. nudiflora]|uniref:Late embryogenesis abundant protein LEA-2 subgroup domain-containing protein n=1 Tax=Prunus yedoensis var. nudiflora TaxID=2094558 RepID=A0A314YT06_PRUYE|nr:uncharacterized protein Pyn_21439 [Prunus yedoensis var. nudiflora]